jgi:hypothetical protein
MLGHEKIYFSDQKSLACLADFVFFFSSFFFLRLAHYGGLWVQNFLFDCWQAASLMV